MTQLTAQDIFDKVVAHLRSMPRRSMLRDEYCAYRSPDGLKCAIGCLIADDEYDPKMEGLTVRALMEDGFLPHVPADCKELLSALQRVHDLPHNWNTEGFCGEAALQRVADRFHLILAPKEQASGPKRLGHAGLGYVTDLSSTLLKRRPRTPPIVFTSASRVYISGST